MDLRTEMLAVDKIREIVSFEYDSVPLSITVSPTRKSFFVLCLLDTHQYLGSPSINEKLTIDNKEVEIDDEKYILNVMELSCLIEDLNRDEDLFYIENYLLNETVFIDDVFVQIRDDLYQWVRFNCRNRIRSSLEYDSYYFKNNDGPYDMSSAVKWFHFYLTGTFPTDTDVVKSLMDNIDPTTILEQFDNTFLSKQEEPVSLYTIDKDIVKLRLSFT